MTIQDSEPSKAVMAVMMKAQKNRPVYDKPVTTAAIHPARFPKKFCTRSICRLLAVPQASE
jgi:hypothetical protein